MLEPGAGSREPGPGHSLYFRSLTRSGRFDPSACFAPLDPVYRPARRFPAGPTAGRPPAPQRPLRSVTFVLSTVMGRARFFETRERRGAGHVPAHRTAPLIPD